MHSQIKLLTCLFIASFFCLSIAAAQTPHVVSVYPPQNALDIPGGTGISATFDMDMDASTFTAASIVVSGSQTGLHAGFLSYDGPSRTVFYAPDNDFAAGEVVSVTLTDGLTSQAGDPLDPPFTWSFRIMADNVLTGYLLEDNRYAGPYGIIDMVSVDVNNDGAIDIAATGYFDDIVGILINDGTGHFAELQEYATGDQPRQLAAADVDADGDQDLIVVNFNDRTLSVHLNPGDGSFDSRVIYSFVNSIYSIGTGDFNGDGYVDLMTFDGTNMLFILLNDGAGGFPTRITHNSGYSITSFFSADVNGDGTEDIYARHQNPDAGFYFLLNNGHAQFTQGPDHPAMFGSSMAIPGDFDGDTDIDIALLYLYSGVTIYRNDGAGNFDSVIFIDGGPYHQKDMTIADFNADGLIDVITTLTGYPGVAVSINNGDMTWSPHSLHAMTEYYAHFELICSADFDGDNDIDFAAQFDGYGYDDVAILFNGQCIDSDDDGFGDPGHPEDICPVDNCPSIANWDQNDFDEDGFGDVCDDCTDLDGDGFGDPGYAGNTCPEDNCPGVYNPDQIDSNGDGIGDACFAGNAVATPAGSDVTVELMANFWITFEQVTQSGITSFSIESSWPPLDYYELLPIGMPWYYNLETTAEFTGDVEICLKYYDNELYEGDEDMIRMEQYWNLGYAPWGGITTYIDDEENTICGTSHTLDPVILARPQYVCGDADHSGSINVGDAVYVINYTFKHGPAPIPRQAADSNADNGVNIADAICDINYCFKGGPPPCCP